MMESDVANEQQFSSAAGSIFMIDSNSTIFAFGPVEIPMRFAPRSTGCGTTFFE